MSGSIQIPADIDPPFSRFQRGAPPQSPVNFEANSSERPGPARESRLARQRGISQSTGAQYTFRNSVFDAYGFAPFTLGNYEFNPGATTIPGYDLALYKTRNMTGTYRVLRDGGMTDWQGGGDSEHPGYERVLFAGAMRWRLSTPPEVDDATDYDQGDGDYPEYPCDPGAWENSTNYDDLVYPWFRSAFPYPPSSVFWLPSSSTSVGPNPGYTGGNVCSASDATITLSEPCTWADLEAQAARVLTEGHTESGAISNFAIAWSTGAGASDGTRYMRKVVGRYQFATQTFRRIVSWREVTRHCNAWDNTSFTDLNPQPTRASEVLSEPIAAPYWDEFGAFSPSALGLDDIPEKATGWRYYDSLGLVPISLQIWGSYTRSVPDGWEGIVYRFGGRFRFMLDTSAAGYQVRCLLVTATYDLDEEEEVVTTETLTLDVVNGLTDVTERIAPAGRFEYGGGEGGLEVKHIEILLDGEVVAANAPTLRILYKVRDRLRVSGFAALDESDTVSEPKRYRVQTRESRWGLNCITSNGAEWDAGKRFQAPCVGEAILRTARAFSATTGLPEWDAVTNGGRGVIEAWEGEFADVPYWPRQHIDETTLIDEMGDPVEETDVELTYEAELLTQPQKLAPIDAAAPAPSPTVLRPPIISSVTRSEVIGADAAGEWHEVDCTTRGAAVYVEDVYVVRMPPAP